MRTHPALFDQPAPLSNNDSLLVALFVAAVIHVVIGLGVNFSAPQPEKVSQSLEITLVNAPKKNAPEKAHGLAQENQLSADEQSNNPEPPSQQLPSQSNSQVQQMTKSAPDQSKPKAVKKLLPQKKAAKKIVAASKPGTEHLTEKRPQLSAEILQQQITQLGTEIRLNQQSAKIKFVDEVMSTHAHVAAQYVMELTDKITRIGKNNYPKEAENFTGSLTMDIGIKADGSIDSIQITQSSGSPALDKAAIDITYLSAPFGSLPADLHKELDVLKFTRIWKFSDESGMSSR